MCNNGGERRRYHALGLSRHTTKRPFCCRRNASNYESARRVHTPNMADRVEATRDLRRRRSSGGYRRRRRRTMVVVRRRARDSGAVMAVGYLPEIGSESGPCKDDCGHVDCAETKRMLLTECRWCDLSIGYRGFYNDTPDGEPAWSRLVHATCHEDTPDSRIPDSSV